MCSETFHHKKVILEKKLRSVQALGFYRKMKIHRVLLLLFMTHKTKRSSTSVIKGDKLTGFKLDLCVFNKSLKVIVKCSDSHVLALHTSLAT